MRSVTNCPECGGRTKHVHTQNRWNHEVRHVRLCKDCPVEYVVSYADPVIEEVTEP